MSKTGRGSGEPEHGQNDPLKKPDCNGPRHNSRSAAEDLHLIPFGLGLRKVMFEAFADYGQATKPPGVIRVAERRAQGNPGSAEVFGNEFLFFGTDDEDVDRALLFVREVPTLNSLLEKVR